MTGQWREDSGVVARGKLQNLGERESAWFHILSKQLLIPKISRECQVFKKRSIIVLRNELSCLPMLIKGAELCNCDVAVERNCISRGSQPCSNQNSTVMST